MDMSRSVFGVCVAPVFPLRNEIPASDCGGCFVVDEPMFDILHEDERTIACNHRAANFRDQRSC
jgi:hypothetical protein